MNVTDFDRLLAKAAIPTLLADTKLTVIRLNTAYRNALGDVASRIVLPVPITELLGRLRLAKDDLKRIVASMTRVAAGGDAEALPTVPVPSRTESLPKALHAWTFTHTPFTTDKQRFVLQRVLDVTDSLDTAAPGDPSLRILLVEDDPDSRQAVEEALQSLGHHVTTTDSAEEALRLARVQRFDVLFSDIGLPDGNGATLVRQLRREQPSLKVILSSGYALPDIDAEADIGQLVKPYDLDRLEEVLNSLMLPGQDAPQ